MTKNNLATNALSPLDGRYFSKTNSLRTYFSEHALIGYRLLVEVSYLLFLSKKGLIPAYSAGDKQTLLSFISSFDEAAAAKVKALEQTTKHDVKAMEYYLAARMKAANIRGVEYVHLALTSEDINSMAMGIGFLQALGTTLLPVLDRLLATIQAFAKAHKAIPMLARTHGQMAVPTTVGKEMSVYSSRLIDQLKKIRRFIPQAKCSGAVGNFNAATLAFPKADVCGLEKEFVASLGLAAADISIQTAPIDGYVELFQTFALINSILIDFDQDIWRYISDGAFKQKMVSLEVGSSTMPQKVNPIDFENSEGNLGLANALFGFFAAKLPISRLQRDLSDSTVKRNFGVAFGHCLLGYESIIAGMGKLLVDEVNLQVEMNDHYEVVMEGVQTLLRLAGDENAYEKIKQVSRGAQITQKKYKNLMASIEVSEEVKAKLLALSPATYLGKAVLLVDSITKKVTLYERRNAQNQKK